MDARQGEIAGGDQEKEKVERVGAGRVRVDAAGNEGRSAWC